MKARYKHLIALSPVVILLGIRQLAIWAYGFFECKGRFSALWPCIVGGFDIVPLIEFGAFFGPLLLMFVVGPLSLAAVLFIAVGQVKEAWLSSRQSDPSRQNG